MVQIHLNITDIYSVIRTKI